MIPQVSWFPVLITLPTLTPMLAAALTLLRGRNPLFQRIVTVSALIVTLVASCMMLYLTNAHGTYSLAIGGWDDKGHPNGPFGITLVVDQLAALMLVVATLVLLCVVVYAIGQGIRDGASEQPVSVFLPTYLILCAGVCNSFLAGDLFNLFVSFEVLLAASFVLLTLGATGDRVRAGASYVMVSMVSSLIFLVGIAFAYATTGTLNLAEMAVRSITSPTAPATRCMRCCSWPSDQGRGVPALDMAARLLSHRPGAVTAVFAGLLTKVGVYAIMRTHTLLFPGGSMDPILLVAGLLTMIVGILGAIAQSDIKRLLSFTLVSHIGYMVFGIALSSELGMSAAIYYVAHHILVQTTLFLVVGLIERQAGSASLRRLGGLIASGAGGPLLDPRAQSRWYSTVLGFPGQGRSHPGGYRERVGTRVGTRGRFGGDQLAHPLCGGPYLDQGILRPRADAPEGELSDSAPSALIDESADIAFDDREDVGRMPITMVVPTALMVAAGIALTIWRARSSGSPTARRPTS